MFADFERIAQILEQLPDGKLAIAFSGGVDSVTLARASEIVLGKENILLLIADSAFAPSGEKNFAGQWAEARKLACIKVPFAPLQDALIAKNDPQRCYYCKKAMFTALKNAALERGFNVLADGENLDDAADYRPGRRAADELNIRHIFVEAKLDKAMIRDLAHDFALPNGQAPASACLASRIPCGTVITEADLQKVDQAEQTLLAMGFSTVRVRCYGDLGKIEVDASDLNKLWNCRSEVIAALQKAGFKRTAMDLQGYERGAVNGASEA